MSRRRSASLSRPVFRDDTASPSKPFPVEAGLDALALAGHDAPPPSRSRSNSLIIREGSLDVELTLQQACEVQVLPSRPILRVRRAAPPSSLPADPFSRLSAPPAPLTGRPPPKRAMTRMVPVEKTYEPNENPLEQPGFREGLLLAGYVAPIDTSRKAIKGRFQHGLEKQEFKAHLDAFLEEKNLKPLGAYMIRFQGPTAEAHSPFVHLFTTTLPSNTSTSQIFADGPDVQKPEISTTWTCLPAESNAQQCTFACKAKRFWPVRVVLEFSSNTSATEPVLPVPATDDRSRRRKRRDTFQREVDLEDEITKQEEREAKELKIHTELDSLRPADLAQLKVGTSAKPPPATSSSPSKREKRKKERRVEPEEQEDEVLTPLTPTILESAKQLGQSIVATVQPVVQTRLDGLKQWWAHRDQQQEGEEDGLFDAEEEERERRRRRRERRERRKAREAREAQERGDQVETAEVNRMADEEEELERAARRKRRAERRARRDADAAMGV